MVEPAATSWLRAETNIDVVEIADAGHVVHRVQPALFLESVRGFVSALADTSES